MPKENNEVKTDEKLEIAEKTKEAAKTNLKENTEVKDTRSSNGAPFSQSEKEGIKIEDKKKTEVIEVKKEIKADTKTGGKSNKTEENPKETLKSKKTDVVEEVESKPKKQESQKGVIHIYSSGNNTILHVTDITGAETISRVSGGMITKADRLKSAPFQGMLAAQRVVKETIERGITEVDIRVRAPGGHKSLSVGKGSQAAIKAISRSDLKINIIEDSTPVIHGYMRKKGGRRGRRL